MNNFLQGFVLGVGIFMSFTVFAQVITEVSSTPIMIELLPEREKTLEEYRERNLYIENLVSKYAKLYDTCTATR